MFLLTEAADWYHPFLLRLIKFTFLYLIPVVLAGYFIYSLWQRRNSPVKALFYVHVFVSWGRKLFSLLYPVRNALSAVLALEVVRTSSRNSSLSLPTTTSDPSDTSYCSHSRWHLSDHFFRWPTDKRSVALSASSIFAKILFLVYDQ